MAIRVLARRSRPPTTWPRSWPSAALTKEASSSPRHNPRAAAGMGAPGRHRRAPACMSRPCCGPGRRWRCSLTIAAGVAIAEGIQAATGSAASVKWPNDVYVGAAKARRHPRRSGHVGDRCVPRRGGLRHQRAARRIPARCRIAGDVARGRAGPARGSRPPAGGVSRRPGQPLCRSAEGRAASVLDAWRARAATTLGRRSSGIGERRPLAGVAENIDDTGALLVVTDAGLVRVIPVKSLSEAISAVDHDPDDASEYCRQVEAYLCRKNDGHLIRIVGPAFEQVCGWAARGVPSRSRAAASIVTSSATTPRGRGAGRCASSSAKRTCSTCSTSGAAPWACQRMVDVEPGDQTQTPRLASGASRTRGRAADRAARRRRPLAGHGDRRHRAGTGRRTGRREGPARRGARAVAGPAAGARHRA